MGNKTPVPVRRAGFTLIELLAVVAVIALLIALLVPAVQRARESARRAECRNNLRQLGLALQNYESSLHVFPPSFVRQVDGAPPPPLGVAYGTVKYRSHWTGYHQLLPYLDRADVHRRYDFNGSWLSGLADADDRRSWPLNRTVIPTLLCPTTPRSGTLIGSASDAEPDPHHWMCGAPTDYAFCHGADMIRAPAEDNSGCPPFHFWVEWPRETRGMFGYNSRCRSNEIRDGLSSTIMLGEKAGAILTYDGPPETPLRMSVEFPWAMAAHDYLAPTGTPDVPHSFWITGPYAVTQDIRPPHCPAQFDRAEPLVMNPRPRQVPASADDRPFYAFQSAHEAGAHFLFADGSVRFLGETIAVQVYKSLSTIDGGEAIELAQ